jgi:tetratricopeptide (TPR) repeat protein
MEELWKGLEAYLEEHAPELRAGLKGPATPAQLKALEAELACELPADLRASLSCHDGEAEGVGFLSHEFLGCEEIAGIYRTQRQIGGSDWAPSWIPVLTDGTGNHIYVVADTGEVRGLDHEGWVHSRVATSLRDLLSDLGECFERERPTYEDEDGWVLEGDEWEGDHDLLTGGEEIEPFAERAEARRAATEAEGIDVDVPQAFEGALGALNAALEADPLSPEARLARGRLYWRSGQPAKACEDLAAEVRRESSDVEAIYLQGRCRWDLEQGDEAKDAFTRYLKRAGSRVEAFGEVKWSGPQPQVGEAVARLEKLEAGEEPEPIGAIDWRRTARRHDRGGETADALFAWATALWLEPNDGQAWLRLMERQREAGRVGEALASIHQAYHLGLSAGLGSVSEADAALEADADDACARFRRGVLRHLADDHLGAIMDLSRIASEQDATVAYGWRGLSRAAQNDAQGAREDLTRALGGRALFGREKLEQALADLGPPEDLQGEEIQF